MLYLIAGAVLAVLAIILYRYAKKTGKVPANVAAEVKAADQKVVSTTDNAAAAAVNQVEKL